MLVYTNGLTFKKFIRGDNEIDDKVIQKYKEGMSDY